MDGIKNYTEDVVENMLDLVLDQYPDICKCDQCKRDIVALALNKLPTNYASTDKGKVFVKLKLLHHQLETDINTALAQAVSVGSKNVHHEK